ncbi:MAG TPA: nuclear transport factor 2 family protein [Candidatus Dormibacteraeota bacterium]|nr:nuclear transport factor 2 family protein [Candidatus Dormibacteraeota bacterium]
MSLQPARSPEELGARFLERANAGDVEGVLVLYEKDAALAFPPGQVTRGTATIRQAYEQLLRPRPTFSGEVMPALICGDLALTSTRFVATLAGPDGRPTAVATATSEIARRQSDGSWLWVIDQPNVLG